MLHKRHRIESKDHKKLKMDTEDMGDSFAFLPEPILYKILWYLPVKDILNAGKVCKRWNFAANDELLWKKKFWIHYKADRGVALKPGADSWKSEYMRLRNNIPFVQAQRIEGHVHQVLHVSFSHNGEMFATCSKDAYVIVWNSDHPCTEKYSHNMKEFSWKYTQYSQFNQSDTLLLVSGVYFGSPHSTSGEIAVFTVDGESHLRCRILNRPYDIFGTWFSDQYLISGGLQWLAHLVSTSVLWLNKANQEIDSEHVPIMNQLYRFYNRNASSVRSVLIARCPWLNDSNDPLLAESSCSKKDTIHDTNTNDEFDCATGCVGNPLSHSATHSFLSPTVQPTKRQMSSPSTSSTSSGTAAERLRQRSFSDLKIRYLAEYRIEKGSSSGGGSDLELSADDDFEDETMDACEEYDEMENSIPKYLIFSTGSKTYTPHEIGIKRIRNVNFPKKLDPGLSLKERIAAKKAAQLQKMIEPNAEPDWWDFDSVAHRFDKVDKIIDLHGHIIGMALSPDHRYLYVNTRPWPECYVITNPLEPPPIAQEIDIHVIDLMTLKSVGNMLRSHKAYTPSTECFFIFLDVCDDYVSSGAEDLHAYLWDRYYGICLSKYKHTDVVNSVAFNPRDSEMLVTTSDDHTIKVWRSRSKAKEYNIQSVDKKESVELKRELI